MKRRLSQVLTLALFLAGCGTQTAFTEVCSSDACSENKPKPDPGEDPDPCCTLDPDPGENVDPGANPDPNGTPDGGTNPPPPEIPLPEVACSPSSAAPLFGAIRWDAWMPGNDAVGWVNPSIYTRYSHRRPQHGWYLTGLDDDSAEQSIVDAEIDVAASSGLDYWAFVWYPTESKDVGQIIQAAFERYQASSMKNRMRFALVLQAFWIAYPNESWSMFESAFVPRFVEWFKDPEYVKVCDGHPLVFLFDVKKIPTARLHALREASIENGAGEPFFVDVNQNIELMLAKGLGGVSSYGPSGAAVGGEGHFCWTSQRQRDVINRRPVGGKKVIVPLTPMADPRPRDYGRWVDQPTQSEWYAHVEDTLAWIRQHPKDVTDPPTALIYSWNEIDEGGPGIVPTEQEGTRYLDGLLAAKAGMRPAVTWNEINPTNCAVTMTGTWDWHFPNDGVQGNYDNDEHRATEPGATLTVEVDDATEIRILGTRGPDRGRMEVNVDDRVSEQVSLYASDTEQRVPLYVATGIGTGPHTVKITVLEARDGDVPGGIVGIDSIRWKTELPGATPETSVPSE